MLKWLPTFSWGIDSQESAIMHQVSKYSTECFLYRKIILAGNYMFKVNNRNTRTSYEMCSKLAKNLLLTLTIFTHCSSVSIVNFELVNTGLGLYLRSAGEGFNKVLLFAKISQI